VRRPSYRDEGKEGGKEGGREGCVWMSQVVAKNSSSSVVWMPNNIKASLCAVPPIGIKVRQPSLPPSLISSFSFLFGSPLLLTLIFL